MNSIISEIKNRGLFFCGMPNCILGPEVWRGETGNIFGLCAKHALEADWINKMPEPVQRVKPVDSVKGFLVRLLESEDGTLDELFPMAQPAPHWLDGRDFPF